MKYYLKKCKYHYTQEEGLEYYQCTYTNGLNKIYEYYPTKHREDAYIPTVLIINTELQDLN